MNLLGCVCVCLPVRSKHDVSLKQFHNNKCLSRGMLHALPIMRHDKPVKIHTQTLEESDDQFLIVL